MATMTADEMGLGLRALPTGEVLRRRACFQAMARDDRRPLNERLAGIVGIQFIDHAIDGVIPSLDPAIDVLTAERDRLTNMIHNLENAK